MWGIVRAIIDIGLDLSEGQYVLLKDPAKTLLRLYQVPSTTNLSGNSTPGAATADAAKDAQQ